jgi:ADP-L-glycero-D-manno-heptose 6-epimerase
MICVTGTSGFIGSRLVKTLDTTEEVISCDVRGQNVLSPAALMALLDTIKPSVVYHLGAISSTTETNTAEISAHNILFSCQLLEYCIANNVPFVYASSASVYGLGTHGFKEDARLSPLNYYAISKASFDQFVIQKIKDHSDAKIYGLRYFNVYGENEDHKQDMASPVHKFFKQSRENGTIKVFEGSEDFFRDFVYVQDVVDITLAIAKSDKSGIYNAGSGVATSFMEVAENVSKITNAKIIKIPFPAHLRGKYQRFTCSENNKITIAGISRLRTPIQEGVRNVHANREN